ncbi:MAG: L-serine ammonia-lyase, iron-sulfur-dependent, subunit alpha [Erysipelotrichaceae bacterium]|nr:L-serine ammonia-lyase, iron-sulfur-dependent, subunit alpha [Erysipelotrichaceae bacterium]
MKAIKHLYRIGYGPSSSHTIGPYRIAQYYRKEYPDCDRYEVFLGGSLALTAKGHGTLDIIKRALECDDVSFTFHNDSLENNMDITGYQGMEKKTTWHGLSLGGGSIRIAEYDVDDDKEVYEENSFEEIKKYLNDHSIDLLTYIYNHEPDLKDHLKECLNVMDQTVENGLQKEGLLNESLKYYRIAKKLNESAKDMNDRLIAYSYAACEENASGGLMCTAPTLGSCGILISLMHYLHTDENASLDHLCDMLAIAGIFGNCIKQNATIAGSIGGCQAEVGTACAMAASTIAFHKNGDLRSIEYAAEMGIEHCLGLTCDPVLGYVIIPCIERNAMYILRAFDCAELSLKFRNIKENVISFDSVVNVMNYTGNKLAVELKETSLGGLSLEYHK